LAVVRCDLSELMHLCSILDLVAGLAVELCMVLMLGKCTCSSGFGLNCVLCLLDATGSYLEGQDVPGDWVEAMVVVDE